MNKQIPKLTDTSEQLIGDALVKVADLVNDGMHPDDAIVKIASAERIPAGHVRLMVRAYNNGRSVGHFKNAGDLEEKAAAFDIADGSIILERMFPSEFKSASVHHEETAVSGDYSMSPAGWRGRREKAAAAKVEPVDLQKAWGLEKAAEYPRQLKDRRALSHVGDMRRHAETHRHQAIKLAYDVANSVDAVTDYFRMADSLPFQQVRENVTLVLGTPGTKLMDKLANEHPQFTKRAGRPHNVNWELPPYSLIKQALERVSEFNTSREAMDGAEKFASEQSQEALRPFVQRPEHSVITGSVWEDPSQTEKQAVGPIGLGLGGAIAGGVGGFAQKFAPKSKDELIDDRMDDLAGTEHEQSLRGIQSKTMLHDLMMNDPVISGYDPDQVVDAYNQISQMAPRATHRRLMAQTLLRKYLEQGQTLDPFDIDQMMDVERKIQGVGIEEADEIKKVRPNAGAAV